MRRGGGGGSLKIEGLQNWRGLMGRTLDDVMEVSLYCPNL